MVEYTVDGVTAKAQTKPDLFSPKDLDQGTKLLLECIPNYEFTSVLDWGCGWGAIALWVAVGFPYAHVLALDSDVGAIKATIFNRELNQVKFDIKLSHGFEDIPDGQSFDLICSNPPTHRGREVVEEMIAQSKTRLNDNGHLLIVVETRLKPWVDRAMQEVFGNCKVEKRGPKNVVLMACKT